MRTTLLASAFALLALVSANGLQPTASTGASPISDDIPAPTLVPIEDEAHLQLRQAAPVTNPAATPVAVQAPTITTNWVRTSINGVVTYVQVAYTQTFAAIPDQWPSPGVGEIGYGTLKMFAQPAEVVMRDVLVKQTLNVLEVVEVVETRTVVEWTTTTIPSNGTMVGIGIGYGSGTGPTAYGGSAPSLRSGRPFASRYYFFG